MIPGINSVSPYVKQQRQGQPQLGEHFIKMKKFIDKDPTYQPETSLISKPPALTLRSNADISSSAVHTTPKAISLNTINAPGHKHSYSKQDATRPNPLKESAKYSLISDANLYYDPITNPIPTLNKNKWNIQTVANSNNRSMTEKLMKRGNQGGQPANLKRSYNL